MAGLAIHINNILFYSARKSVLIEFPSISLIQQQYRIDLTQFIVLFSIYKRKNNWDCILGKTNTDNSHHSVCSNCSHFWIGQTQRWLYIIRSTLTTCRYKSFLQLVRNSRSSNDPRLQMCIENANMALGGFVSRSIF